MAVSFGLSSLWWLLLAVLVGLGVVSWPVTVVGKTID
jgi:hypothetical protein